ncbi:MAG: DUF58 domain-containing protein [Defluviitaleaceae bacterium]|nr:DUF58 domain-containing protein [Defluviitaleaceae bacterium]
MRGLGQFRIKPIHINRLIYLVILAAIGSYAWLSGERVLYVGVAVLLCMPVFSYILALVMLRSLRIKQAVPKTIVKGEEGAIKVQFYSIIPMPLNNIECIFFTDEHAINAKVIEPFGINPYRAAVLKAPFTAVFRGEYVLGLRIVRTTDIMGLFRLRRRVNKAANVTVLPRLRDFQRFSLASNVFTQASSRFDIRDEDYATIADVRPYMPSDSIKRVHWKLTAKRNEWLVKIFQSNALNQVTLILDSQQLQLDIAEKYTIEDAMVEEAVSIMRFCANRGIPLGFHASYGYEAKVSNLQEFEHIYLASAGFVFQPTPKLNPLAILTHVLNETTGYANAIILTSRLDQEIFERILSSVGNGHHVAVIYFATASPDAESEKYFRIFSEGGMPCFRV